MEFAEDRDAAFVTAERLSALIGREVVGCELDSDDLDKLSICSYMRWGTLKFATAPLEQRVVLKVGKQEGGAFGMAREGMFFSHWKDLVAIGSSQAERTRAWLGSFLPQVLFAEADMEANMKRILMEDLSECVQCGFFFGGRHPMNWGKDLEKERRGITLSEAEIVKMALSVAAKLHASFWNCRMLPAGADVARGQSFTWLGASEWLAGCGRETWEAKQKEARQNWEALKASFADGSSAITWDPLVVECLDAAVAKASWDDYQAELKTRPFTLVHGDLHPANFMLKPAADSYSMVLLDWELVGLGSGFQDVAVFMLSHTDPKLRAELERPALEAYFAELKAVNPDIAMTWDDCWAEYVAGGAGKGLWFLQLMGTAPAPMIQFFHDQVLAFLRDHGVKPAMAPMLRVGP